MEEEVDIKEILGIFWKKKLIIIFFTLLFIAAGTIYTTYYKIPMYKSTTTLLLAQNSSMEENKETINEITQTDITLNQNLVSTYSVLVKSKSVINQVLKNLNMSQELEENIRKSITVNAVTNTQVLEITYVSDDAKTAYKVANELANVFCVKVREIYNINNVYVVDKAELQTSPYNINKVKDIGIFAIGGIAFSCIVIFISILLDTTVKNSEDIEKNTGLIVLAKIPEVKAGGKK